MKRFFLMVGLFAMLVFLAAPVQALPIPPEGSWMGFFTSDHLTGGAGTTPPYGNVILTQDGPDVDFLVTLIDGFKFVRTGAGDDMNFKFNGIGVALSDISGTGLTAAQGDFAAHPPQFCGDNGGCYLFGVYFAGQSTGGGAGIANPIEFTVANATIAELIVPEPTGKAGNQIFVADVIASNGNTGLVDVGDGRFRVPEPGTLLLLGSGLVAVGGFAWMRRRQ